MTFQYRFMPPVALSPPGRIARWRRSTPGDILSRFRA